MLTSTLSLSWSSLISAIWPEKSANGPFLDPHALAHLVLEAGPGLLGRIGALGLDLQERLDVLAGQGVGLAAVAHEAGDAGRVAHDVPGVVVELAAHQQVAGEHLLLDDDLLAALELDDVLDGDDDLVDPVLHVHGGDAALEVRLHLVLVAGVGVDHEPLARAGRRGSRRRVVVLVALDVLAEEVLGEHDLVVAGRPWAQPSPAASGSASAPGSSAVDDSAPARASSMTAARASGISATASGVGRRRRRWCSVPVMSVMS